MCAFTACPNTGEIVQNGVCTCPVGQAGQNGACASKSNWFNKENTGKKKRQKGFFSSCSTTLSL